jgi:hypothetical protein
MNETTTASAEVLSASPGPLDQTEVNLTAEIEQLWQVHSKAQTSLSRSRAEAKVVRDDLSRRLHELKSVLSRPGRGGAWSSFLEAQKIPRSSADRFVRSHEKKVASEKNCTTEQIVEPTAVTVRRYLQGLWPRLSRVLTTREAVDLFIDALQQAAEKSICTSLETPSSARSAGAVAAV